MSTKKRRAAFDPNALNDLDDLLPPLNLVRDAAAAGGNTPESAAQAERSTAASQAIAITSDHNAADNEAAVSESADVVLGEARTSDQREVERQQASATAAEDEYARIEGPAPTVAAPTETDDKQTSSTRRADARRKTAKRDVLTSTNRIAPPEVALPEEIYGALRSLTLNERSADPTTARSYGQVVLDAVEQHADELKAHWANDVTAPGTGLFRRAEAGKPTRRRHNAPRARVPLAGVINTDAAVLDQLASDWGAGSRSALVEQALRLYLRVN
ncbi:hypothetical protein [Rhodococcoides yunnanense]|uniref:hypothetical protein n=1 Tax=Rhodococcoides yunnanense TaxID=278209 RepID=UPI0022B17DCF|nr:hypothetical protein [Rhodococcus yunnanensis]MCZ4277454.1 hypothetical protein [Rhodococcus yunnanensis]